LVAAVGYRASMAASILERNGFKRISNVVGGMSAWTAANYETSTEAVTQTTRVTGVRDQGKGVS